MPRIDTFHVTNVGNPGSDQIQRLIRDAHQAFIAAEAEAMARYEASIISTGSQN